MNCKKIQEQILQGCAGDKDVEMHLTHCPHCRDFITIAELLQTQQTLQEPSSQLDAAVQHAAQDKLRQMKIVAQHRAPIRFHEIRRHRTAWALAASLVLCAVLVWLSFKQYQPLPQVVTTVPAEIERLSEWHDDVLELALASMEAELMSADYAPRTVEKVREYRDGLHEFLLELEMDVLIEKEMLLERPSS